MLENLLQSRTVVEYAERELAGLMVNLRLESLRLLQVETGRWETVASAGTAQPLFELLLSEALDRETPVWDGPRFAVPLRPTPYVLQGVARTGQPKPTTERLLLVAQELTPGLRLAVEKERDQRRLARLESLLKITAQWNQVQDTEELLQQMAETATRLLNAERASIFLWDRSRGELVARPALGVTGGELRLADDRGVVGQVIRTGLPRRVAAEPRMQAAPSGRSAAEPAMPTVTATITAKPGHGTAGDKRESPPAPALRSSRATAQSAAANPAAAKPAPAKSVDLKSASSPARIGEEIDRRVDEQLGFHTRNLLCVPLRTARGDLLGAFELLNKRQGDFTAADEQELMELAAHAAVALENTRQRAQLLKVREHLAEEAIQGTRLIGTCPAIAALQTTIQRVAQTELAVLILGENGTGKDVVAKRIHYLSPRRHQPFVAVNCAALTESLLESELFGHEKGAFTDAHAARPGKFELASGGTLLLDEIGDMSLGGQAKLLRVLEEKIVVRVGGSTPIPTDTRVLAATNQNLAELVRLRRFREDLYFRLTVVTIELPPLRDRGNDLLELAEFFLQTFCQKARRVPPQFTPAARQQMLAHPWPGNVRELRNLMERVAFLSTGDTIDLGDLPFNPSPRTGRSEAIAPIADSGTPASSIPGHLPLDEATRQFQADYIRQALTRSRGNVTEAAERLGLHRANLYRKLRQLGETL